MRFIYLDESGISTKERVPVVAGVIVNADKELSSVEEGVQSIIADVALHFGVYNFVRQHHTLATTPAVAAGLEEKPWSLEQVVEMTEVYCIRKRNQS